MMTNREIERAINANPDFYPRSTDCAICGQVWLAHNGELCPICSICKVHGTRHRNTGDGLVVVETRAGFAWCLCSEGLTTFVPVIEGAPEFDV